MDFLRIKNITKKYKINGDDYVILNNINYTFPSHGLVFIYGKSGSGKSTLLNLLLGIDEPSRGEICFRNHCLNNFTLEEKYSYYKNNISLLFQHYNLFENLSAFENVKLGCLFDEENIDENANKLFNKFNLNYLKSKEVKHLSGGEKQRIAFLRAIIKNPDILLADEPTGAIPRHTAIDLLDYLKEYSKEKLVIIVSHNHELLKEYADIILEINNGNIIGVLNNIDCKNPIKTINNQYIKTNSFKSLKSILFARIKEDWIKNLLIMLSTFFSYTFLILSVGFINGINITTNEDTKKTLLYNFAEISQETYQSVEASNLLLTKQVRPNKEILNSFLPTGVEIKENLSYFINPFSRVICQEEIVEDTLIYPYYLDNPFLIEYQKAHNIKLEGNSLFINDIFLQKLNLNQNEIIGKKINVSNDVDVFSKDYANNKTINDLASFNLEFIVAGVIEEFAFLNSPKIYYSYDYLYEYLSNCFLENHSAYFKRSYSCLDLLFNSDDASQFNMYSYWLNLNNISPEELNTIIDENDFKDGNLALTSEYLSIKESYSSLMNVFAKAFFIFTILSFVLVNIIIALTVLSSFLLKKKENAILLILGISYRDIFLLYFVQNLILIFLSLLVSFIFFKPIEILLNTIIFHFTKLNKMINVPFFSYFNLPLFLPVIMILVNLIVVFLSLILIFLIAKRISLKEELVDE